MASSSFHDHKTYASSHLQTLAYLLPVLTAAIYSARRGGGRTSLARLLLCELFHNLQTLAYLLPALTAAIASAGVEAKCHFSEC